MTRLMSRSLRGLFYTTIFGVALWSSTSALSSITLFMALMMQGLILFSITELLRFSFSCILFLIFAFLVISHYLILDAEALSWVDINLMAFMIFLKALQKESFQDARLIISALGLAIIALFSSGCLLKPEASAIKALATLMGFMMLWSVPDKQEKPLDFLYYALSLLLGWRVYEAFVMLYPWPGFLTCIAFSSCFLVFLCVWKPAVSHLHFFLMNAVLFAVPRTGVFEHEPANLMPLYDMLWVVALCAVGCLYKNWCSKFIPVKAFVRGCAFFLLCLTTGGVRILMLLKNTPLQHTERLSLLGFLLLFGMSQGSLLWRCYNTHYPAVNKVYHALSGLIFWSVTLSIMTVQSFIKYGVSLNLACLSMFMFYIGAICVGWRWWRWTFLIALPKMPVWRHEISIVPKIFQGFCAHINVHTFFSKNVWLVLLYGGGWMLCLSFLF